MFRLFLIAFLFSSCSTSKLMKTSPVKLSEGLIIETGQFLSIVPKNKKIVQVVTYERGEVIKKMQVIFINRSDLRVTALSLLGVEIATLVVTDEGVKKIGGIPQFTIDEFSRVMGDMLVVYATKNVLYSNIRGDFTISDNLDMRKVYQKENKAVSIKYSNVTDKWLGNIEFVNHQFGYKLKVKTIEVNDEGIHK